MRRDAALVFPRGTAYQHTARKRPETPDRRPRGEIPRRPAGARGGEAPAPSGGCPRGIPGGRPRPRSAPPGKEGKRGPAAAEPGKGARRRTEGPRGPLPRAPRPAFPELLAPAGSAEAYYAAVDAGADAVYLGLGKFNARERAENFNLADLCRIRPHARARGVRLYVAMNTLLTEADLPEAIGLLHQVAPLSARRDHRGGSRAGADPPRILPGDSRAHEHAGRLRLRGGGGGVRPDGGVPGHPRTAPAQGRDRPDRRALSRGRGDLRPRVDVLLLFRQMLLLLVPRRQEREPRGMRPAVPAPVRPRGGAGSDLLHPRPVPSPAPPGPRSPRDRRAEDRGADAGGGVRGRRRVGVPGGPRRDPGGEPGGGGGRGDADPLAGHRTGDDPRAAGGRARARWRREANRGTSGI